MDRIQDDMTKKTLFLRISELNGSSLSFVDQSEKLLGTTQRIWTTLSLCLKFITLIVSYLSCLQYMDKSYFFMLV